MNRSKNRPEVVSKPVGRCHRSGRFGDCFTINPVSKAALVLLIGLTVSCVASRAPAEERLQNFDSDPGWEGRNHRALRPEPRTIRQDFGYSSTRHAGGTGRGEIGGHVTPAAEPAYYAKPIATKRFDDALSASGRLVCTGREFHLLLGFFNAGTLNEWRTPNSIALRLYGRGDRFYAYVEYCTRRWRAGGDNPQPFPTIRDEATGRPNPRGFASGEGVVHTWSLRYDPAANHGGGAVIAVIDGDKAVCHLDPGHKADGATFNRFGLLNVIKHADTGGELWLDDLSINGETERFDRDPGWDAFQNRRSYVTENVRPRFNFGFSPTRHARGKRSGELGGLLFRGDNRNAERMASYADRLDKLTLDRPLRVAGKVCLRRGISDSTTLLGFFNSAESMAANGDQSSGFPDPFLGIAVEGPSSEGFYFYPVSRVGGDIQGGRRNRGQELRIAPDSAAHDWRLEYAPPGEGERGQLMVTLDDKSVRLELSAPFKTDRARFDRFGLITTWVDGNGQEIYFDDLRYTFRQE